MTSLKEENASCSSNVDAGLVEEVATISLVSTVESGFLDFFSFGSSWDGPPMDRLQEEGLGKGIDATRLEELLHTQLLPTEENLETVTVGTGYQEFNETLETMTSLKKSLSSSVGVKGVEVVSFKVGFEFKRDESSRKKMTAHGKQIHNETVRFKTENISRSSIHLVDLLKRATKENGFEYSQGKDIPEHERNKICKDVVRIQNNGVTHYISSVDLGAKVYEVTMECEQMTQEQKGVNAKGGGGTGQVMVKVPVDFSTETKEMSTASENQIKFVIDPDVELKSEHTHIDKDQEKTIAYKVTPVWQLVKDRAWRESVKKACKDYVDERTDVSVGPESSFLIKIGHQNKCLYLKVTDDQVVGTCDRKEAHSFTALPVESPESNKATDMTDNGDTGFFLCYQEPVGGYQRYITADPQKGIIAQTSVEEKEQAKFYLTHPATKQPEAISAWEKRTPLLLHCRLEKSKWLVLKEHVKVFLDLQKMADKHVCVLRENKDGFHPDCVFSLEHP